MNAALMSPSQDMNTCHDHLCFSFANSHLYRWLPSRVLTFFSSLCCHYCSARDQSLLRDRASLSFSEMRWLSLVTTYPTTDSSLFPVIIVGFPSTSLLQRELLKGTPGNVCTWSPVQRMTLHLGTGPGSHSDVVWLAATAV